MPQLLLWKWFKIINEINYCSNAYIWPLTSLNTTFSFEHMTLNIRPLPANWVRNTWQRGVGGEDLLVEYLGEPLDLLFQPHEQQAGRAAPTNRETFVKLPGENNVMMGFYGFATESKT